MRLGQQVSNLLESTLDPYIDDPSSLRDLGQTLRSRVSAQLRKRVDTVLQDSRTSYRDGVLIQLAFALCDPQTDTTMRSSGARGVAGRLGKFFSEHHIRAVSDAYQNIARNSRVLARGNFPDFDELLRWANTASAGKLQSCFAYACCAVASTARPVLPMPELDAASLTFARVMAFYEQLMSTPSEGVHEQFIVASLLDALVSEYAPPQYRVDTKRVSASDKSSRTAGDVQIMTGNRVLEAYEVTGAGWEAKLRGVTQTVREHDLARMHVVAPLGSEGYSSVLNKLLALDDDVSVVGLSAIVSVAVSALTRQFRAHSLRRMYELLDRLQRDIRLVNAYVKALYAADLALRPFQGASEGNP